MNVSFASLTPTQRYKLLSALIVPRPIALITTVDADGATNAAPFSLFNMVGEDPPTVMFSANKLDGGAAKDTVRNVLTTGEFVVHLVDETMAQALHDCSHAFDASTSEIDALGLAVQPSVDVRPPRLSGAAAAFECVLQEKLESDSRHIFFGTVLRMHVPDGLVDLARCHVDLPAYAPIGRLGSGLYVRTQDRFTLALTVDSQ